MYLKKNLVYDKRTGKIVGYLKLDALQVELKKMEELLNQEALSETPTPGDAPSPVAEKILCAMIIGPTNGIKAE